MLGLGLGTGAPRSRAAGLAIPSNAVFLCDGDSISAETDGLSLAGHLAVRTGGRMTFVANAYPPPPNARPGTIGVGGKKIADQTLNVAAAFSADPAVTHIVFHCGTNDMSPTPESQMRSDFLAYCDAWNSRGVKVIYSCILKRIDTVGLNAGNEDKRKAFNAWAAGQVGTHGLAAVVNYDATFDPAVMPALIQADGIHPTVAGMRVITGNIVTALSFQASDYLSLMPGANVVPNPTFATPAAYTTGFTADSVVPNGWTISNGSGATVKASVLDIGGTRVFEFLGSGSATSAVSDLRLSRNISELALAAGQWVEGGLFVDIGNAAGTGDAVGLTGWSVATGDAYVFRKDHTASSSGALNWRFTGFVRVPPVKENAASTFQAFGFYCRMAAGPVDFRIRLWSPFACVAG